MRVLALDPGPKQTAFLDLVDGVPETYGIEDNETVLDDILSHLPGDRLLAVEMIASYGMPVGAEVFETCVWIGRFIERWGGDYVLVYRKDVKMHHCGSVKAKDANIRQALIDRFGGKAAAIGSKKTPGPLYGIKADEWAALAVALTVHDKQPEAA